MTPSDHFIKKPIVIRAFQMTEERRWDNSEWPNWLNKAWQTPPGEGSVWVENLTTAFDARLMCGTLEGPLCIGLGDWIIEGPQGELYPCKPDIFETIYEPAGREGDD